MNQDVGDPRQFVLQRRPYVSANRVGCRDRLPRIDFDVQVDVMLQARLSCEHFVDTLNTLDGPGHPQDLAGQFPRRHGVYELERRIPQDTDARNHNDDADEESAVVTRSQEPDRVPRVIDSRDSALRLAIVLLMILLGCLQSFGDEVDVTLCRPNAGRRLLLESVQHVDGLVEPHGVHGPIGVPVMRLDHLQDT